MLEQNTARAARPGVAWWGQRDYVGRLQSVDASGGIFLV